MKLIIALVAGLAACAEPDVPGIPWLYGLTNVVASDSDSYELGYRMAAWSERADYDPACPPGSSPAVQVVADVAPTVGSETIWVSLAHGVAVFDREGQLVTETPGYRCEGSADQIEALAAGDAFGEPTIALAATSGSRRASSTWITLLRVGPDRQLEAAFTGTVEERDGDGVQRGALILLPNALIYRHPRAKPKLMLYNPAARAYLVPGEAIDNSHDDGPSITVSRRP